MKTRFEGIITATPTPLDPAGEIVPRAVLDHVERQIRAGIGGIIPIGGTGEFTNLSEAQRLRMIELTVEAVNGRVPVIAGVLHPGLHDAARAASEYLAAGADAAMVVTPFYSRPTQAGLVEYFRRLADKIDGALVLYEIPYRTGVSLLPETVAAIVEQTRTVAMKACNPDLAQQMRVVEATRGKIPVFSGDETVFPLHVAVGAKGGMLAGSNVLPNAWIRIFRLASQGNLQAAVELHAKLRATTDALYSEPNPAPLKAAMTLLGAPAGSVLAPLLPATEDCVERLRRVLPAAMALEATCEVEAYGDKFGKAERDVAYEVGCAPLPEVEKAER